MTSLHEHYEQGRERERLDTPRGRVEYLRTLEVLEKVLPPAPATVADIGGGPGRYTRWLAGRGYAVIHRDIVPLHVEQVRQDVGLAGVDSAVGDARELDLADSSVDAVLMLGPLYHLPDRADRLRALAEARRIVRPGGPVVVVAISRWAPRLDDTLFKRLPGMAQLIDDVERTGFLPAVEAGWFTGYTHRPDEPRAEVAEAGLTVEDLVGLEGPAFLLGDLADRLSDDAGLDLVLETARRLERVPELLGFNLHLLVVSVATVP